MTTTERICMVNKDSDFHQALNIFKYQVLSQVGTGQTGAAGERKKFYIYHRPEQTEENIKISTSSRKRCLRCLLGWMKPY